MTTISLKRLDQITDGDPEIKKEILTLFKASCDRCMHAMLTHESDANASTWANALHELKGAADNLGFEPVADIAREAEEEMREGTMNSELKQVYHQRIESMLLTVQQAVNTF